MVHPSNPLAAGYETNGRRRNGHGTGRGRGDGAGLLFIRRRQRSRRGGRRRREGCSPGPGADDRGRRRDQHEEAGAAHAAAKAEARGGATARRRRRVRPRRASDQGVHTVAGVVPAQAAPGEGEGVVVLRRDTAAGQLDLATLLPIADRLGRLSDQELENLVIGVGFVSNI